jgi:hypothetical protein
MDGLKEISFPAINHFKTVFSNNVADEGASYIRTV